MSRQRLFSVPGVLLVETVGKCIEMHPDILKYTQKWLTDRQMIRVLKFTTTAEVRRSSCVASAFLRKCTSIIT